MVNCKFVPLHVVARSDHLVVVDGVDRTECCASNGVNGHCLAGCSGNATNFPANPLECQAHMFTFASCYDVPVPPMSPSPGKILSSCFYRLHISVVVFMALSL